MKKIIVHYRPNIMKKEVMDYLLSRKNLAVVFLDDKEYKEWVWQETFPNGATMCVHGADEGGYKCEDAYEDAFRHCMGLDPIADEAKLLM